MKKLAVITPVGPGHCRFIRRCRDSVSNLEFGSFDAIQHIIVNDLGGKLGRSTARNLGMAVEADWFFFLDVDDSILPDATTKVDFSKAATFGAVMLGDKVSKRNVYPCEWEDIYTHGPRGTLSMGFFVEAEIARTLKFDESLEVGEDFDFYMRLPDFVKIEDPLVSINYYWGKGTKVDWFGACQEVIDKYKPKETLLSCGELHDYYLPEVERGVKDSDLVVEEVFDTRCRLVKCTR